jgi:hypothetical protein
VQLPRAPEAIAAEEEAARLKAEAEARARYEADAAALRQLRMALREAATKLLGDRRWRSLAMPVSPEEDPEYWERVRRSLSQRAALSHVYSFRAGLP